MKRHLMTLAAAVVLTLVAASAWAYWSAGSVAGSNGTATATTVNQGATPTASASASNVTVSWAATTLANGQPVNGYLVKRYDATTSAAQTVLPGCAGTLAATSCVENGVPDGVWRYTVTPVFATNWRGAESAKSATVTTDVTAPAAPAFTGISSDTGASATDRITSAASQTLTGSAEAGSTVTVRRGATVLGTATANGSGVFSFGPVTLTLGTNTFTATATDAAGNTSAASAGFVVTLDTVEPFSVVISPSGSAWRSTGAWSITADDALSGIHHVSYKVDAAGYLDLPATNGVAVSPPALADGVHTVFAYATDVAGKSTSATPVNATIRVDGVKPTASIVLSQAPNADGWRTSGLVTVSGTDATSGVDHVEYKIDGAPAYTSGANGVSFVLADGTHSVTARAVDAAGNVGDPVTVTGIKVDSTPPGTTAITSSQTPNANGWIKANTTLTLAPTDATPGSGIKNVQYRTRVNAGAWSGWTALTVAPYTLAVSAEGVTDVEVFATDVAGNLESPVRTYTVKLDKTNPSITTVTPASSTTVWRSSNQLTITAADTGSGVAYVEYRLGTSGPYTQVGNGVAITLPQGTNTVYYHAVDEAGNASADNATAHTVLVDTTAPTLSNPVPANSTAASAWVNIDCESGTFANRVCVDVNDAGGSGLNAGSVTFKLVRTSTNQCWNGSTFVAGTGCAAQAMTAASGAQYRSGGNALAGMTDGTYTVTFAASDNAGNAAAPLTTTFTVESAPPTGTITNPSGSTYSLAGCGTPAIWDLCGTATDTGSGVDRVEFELRQQGFILANDRCLAPNGSWSAAACDTNLTATLDGAGNWGYATGALPGDGFFQWNGYTVTVYIYDRAGNLTTLTRNFNTP